MIGRETSRGRRALAVGLLCVAAFAPASSGGEARPGEGGAGVVSLASVAVELAGDVLQASVEGEENLTAKAARMAVLARLFARAGHYDRALAMIAAAEPPRVRSDAYGAVASVAAAAGDLARADDVARRLAALDEWTTPGALAAVAAAFQGAGEDERFARLVASLGDERERALALARAARTLPEGARDRALEILRRALVAESTSAGEPVVFAVHSPSRFFAGHRLRVPEGREVPPGSHLFTLWKRADGGFDLEVDPAGREGGGGA